MGTYLSILLCVFLTVIVLGVIAYGVYFVICLLLDILKGKKEATNEQALKNAVDYIIHDCGVDCCKICVKYNPEEQSRDLPDDVEPCSAKFCFGERACIEGVQQYFKK